RAATTVDPTEPFRITAGGDGRVDRCAPGMTPFGRERGSHVAVPRGVTAALVVLVHSVLVRVQAGEQGRGPSAVHVRRRPSNSGIEERAMVQPAGEKSAPRRRMSGTERRA